MVFIVCVLHDPITVQGRLVIVEEKNFVHLYYFYLWPLPPSPSVRVCDAEPQHRLHQQLRGVGGAPHIQLLQAARDYRNR